MLIVGDVHGKVRQYQALIENADKSFQVGDMGLGFRGVSLPAMDPKHKFIRGNHDCPEVCREHSNYVGDYGFLLEDQIFYLGGAWSIDQAYRVEGLSWWRDEELSYPELKKAIHMYTEAKPHIVISHDCPEKIGEMVVNKGPGFYVIGGDGKPIKAGKIKTRTGEALQQMWEAWQPVMWIFGHYHQSFDMKLAGTRFVCLNELETISI